MNKIVAALLRLYKELGNDIADVKNCKTTVDVLNALSVKYNGEGGAKLTAKAIDNIANVAGNIGGGEPKKYKISVDPSISTRISIGLEILPQMEFTGGDQYLVNLHHFGDNLPSPAEIDDMIIVNDFKLKDLPHVWVSNMPFQFFGYMPQFDITFS